MTATTRDHETASGSNELFGAVDEISMQQISGWARYPEGNDVVRLDLQVNGEVVGGFEANEFRHDLTKMREDGRFAFHVDLTKAIHPVLAPLSLRDCVPQDAEVLLVDAKSGAVIPGGSATWAGTAPADQQGLALPDGQRVALLKGVIAIPISARPPGWRASLSAAAKSAIDAGAAAGIRLALGYGSLLGAVRAGRMIDHDDDMDLILITRANNVLDAVQEMKAAQSFFLNLGYKIIELSNGQFKLLPDSPDIELDVFLAWSEGDALALSFTVKSGPALQDVLPLIVMNFEGVSLPVPRRPELLLAAIYGESWEIPNPRFRWEVSQEVAEFFAPVHNYDRGAHGEYWNAFYADPSAPSYPSQFAAFALSRLSPDTFVVDLGCGSGRDTEFFVRYGHDALGIDYSGPAVEFNTARAMEEDWGNRVQFNQFDMSNLTDVHAALEQVDRLREGRPVLIYSRFFFHAVDDATEGGSLIFIREVLSRSVGEALIEFRTTEDEDRLKVHPNHYRRYVATDDLVRRAAEIYGLDCAYRVEGLGYATFKTEDARVARLSLVRR